MTMEGRRESERLAWLIKRHVSRFYSISTKLIREAQATGVVRPGDPGQLHYCAIGIATSAFSLAPEYKLVTGKDPFARSHIEQIADLVCDFLFARPEKEHQRREINKTSALVYALDRLLAAGSRITNLPAFSPL